jgi:hypothetical protein
MRPRTYETGRWAARTAAENGLAHGRPDRIGCDEVHPAGQNLLRTPLQPDESEQADRPRELDQKIQILASAASSRAADPRRKSDWTP